MFQKVLVMVTEEPHLRSQAEGWDVEDSALYQFDKDIGFTSSPPQRLYKTVLEALANHWNLLAPPQAIKIGDFTRYEWWLTKESPV